MSRIISRKNPILDGATEQLGDGQTRPRAIKIPAGSYTPPVWLRPDSSDALTHRIDSLPWQGVIRAGVVDVLSSAPGGSPSLTRGAGANIPNGGVGWSLWHELDVTQNDQSAIKSSLGSLANIGFIGGRWTTPDGNGSGAYFDQVVDGRRCMEFRWGAGGSSEGRCALHEMGTGTQYDLMYQRCIVRLTVQEHWPANSIKLLRTLRNQGGGGNGFLNIGANVANDPPTPWFVSFTNMVSGGTTPPGQVGMEYKSTSLYGPGTYDQWFEVEVVTQSNSANGVYDGRGKVWFGPVGAPVRVDTLKGSDGDPTINADEFTNAGWVVGGTKVGHGFYDFGPYLGGTPGITLTQDQSIYFATHSIWVM